MNHRKRRNRRAKMYSYKITPKQPLIFRDGKPFGTDDNIADTLPFPLPSTIAGALRTAWADSEGKDYTDSKQIEKIKSTSVCGPLLTRSIFTETQETTELLFPSPADAVCLLADNKTESHIYRLQPQNLKTGEGINQEDNLAPVFMIQKIKGKPSKDAPAFWSYKNMVDWLASDNSDELIASSQGGSSLAIETRTHVAIESKRKTAKAGHLFQTAGLDFGQHRKSNHQAEQDKNRAWGWEKEEYGLACEFSKEIPQTYRTIGGESRLGYIRRQDDLFPHCPIEISKAINQTKGFRLILITPAIFKNGYIPSFITDTKTMQGEYNGMKLKLHAVSMPRWQAGTSWDMAAKGEKHNSQKGKGMNSLKRLAPAGTVYWFELLEPKNMQVDSFWLSNLSDERANDGYGLTLPGVWNIEKFKEDANNGS